MGSFLSGFFGEPGKRTPVYTVQIDGKDELDMQAVKGFVDCGRSGGHPHAIVEVGRAASCSPHCWPRKAFYEGRTTGWEELGV